MRVDIRCRSKTSLNLSELTDFQGNLKERTNDDIRRISDSIKQHGFSFPFFVWANGGQNLIIDGHGRYAALHSLAEEGYEIPALPVVYIKAETEDMAKALLLQVNSLYGETSSEVLLSIVEEIGASLEDFSFPQVVFDFDKDSPAEYFAPELTPVIDTSEVDADDIERAERKLEGTKKDDEMVEFTCNCCGGSIFVKRDVIVRYLRGEHV